jgi:hypothetical protein
MLHSDNSETKNDLFSTRQPGGLIPAKEAAMHISYSADYISRLAREKKIVAEQRNRQWYVSLDSVKQFSLNQQAEQRARQQRLRRRRINEYARKQSAQIQTNILIHTNSSRAQALLMTAGVTTCLLLLGSLGWVGYQERLQIAQLHVGFETVVGQVRDIIPIQLPPARLTFFEVGVEENAPPRITITFEDTRVTAKDAPTVLVSDSHEAAVEDMTPVVLTPVFVPMPNGGYVQGLAPDFSMASTTTHDL